MQRLLGALALALLGGAACAHSPASGDLGLVPAATCAHGAPADECTRCAPERAAAFRERGDWCAEHDLPESHCTLCHPGIAFYVLPPIPPGADVVHLSRMGEDVPALTPVPGKITVVDFFAHWCAPCKAIDAYVLGLLARRGDVAYRKINIQTWDSAVAQRYLTAASGLPYVMVFDRRGQQVGTAREPAALAALIEAAP